MICCVRVGKVGYGATGLDSGTHFNTSIFLKPSTTAQKYSYRHRYKCIRASVWPECVRTQAVKACANPSPWRIDMHSGTRRPYTTTSGIDARYSLFPTPICTLIYTYTQPTTTVAGVDAASFVLSRLRRALSWSSTACGAQGGGGTGAGGDQIVHVDVYHFCA